MTILDWALLVIVAFFFVRGFFRGFLLEVFEIVALIAGYIVARFWGPVFGLFLANHTPLQRGWAGIIAAVLLFFAAAIAVGLIGRLLRKIARAAALGWIDRFAGALIGLLKSIIIILFIMLLLSFLPLPKSARNAIMNGPLTGVFWLGAGMTWDKMKAVPLAPARIMASFLRSYGLNDEVVHIVTDQPELMQTLLSNAPPDIDDQVKSILSGEPATKMPPKLNMPGEVNRGIVEALENPDLSNDQKSEIFWTMIRKAQPEK